MTGIATALASGAAFAAAAPATAAPTDYVCGDTTCTFAANDTKTSFTIPAGVTEVYASVLGSYGGEAPGARASWGGLIQFTLPVKSGDVLSAIVGHQGLDGATDGNGAVTPSTGGGASSLSKNGTLIAVGGGGGGAALNLTGGNGGSAGACQSGTAGASSGGTPSTPGTGTDPGTGGIGAAKTGGSGTGPASAGSIGKGGTVTVVDGSPFNGGGGGGGYYGGGAGGSAPATGGAHQAGSGGSGYLAPEAHQVSSDCATGRNSLVRVSFDLPTDVEVPAIHPAVAAGGVVTAAVAAGAFWLRRRTRTTSA